MSEAPPIHGNYRGYYHKRPSFRDPRLALIPQDLFQDARVLDVGCNEGWITCDIARYFGAKKVIGVDIDDLLIRAAWKRRRTVWSQDPLTEDSEDDSNVGNDLPLRSENKQTNDEKSTETSLFRDEPRFPAAFEHMFGPLSIPPTVSGSNDNEKFPHNVIFRAADWVNGDIIEDRDGYDIVLGLSITKWIHLNDGDDGIRTFFARVYSVLRPGGVFIVEPQEWESYAKARRMDPKLKENAQKLQLRPPDFENILIELGFDAPTHLGQTGKGGFQRPLDLYVKQDRDR